tara:strand:- start:299 stop:1078 length:780 start_codon:yes stop_codon:yes gene_type:complete
MDVLAAEGHTILRFCYELKFNEPSDWVPPMPPSKYDYNQSLRDIATANFAIKHGTVAPEDVADWHYFLYSVYKFLAIVEISRRGLYPGDLSLDPILAAFTVAVIASNKHGVSPNLVPHIAVGAVLNKPKKLWARDTRRSWTPAETKLLCSLFKRYGKQWALIAAHFPDRTPDSIRNHYFRISQSNGNPQEPSEPSEPSEPPEPPEPPEPLEPQEPQKLPEPQKPPESPGPSELIANELAQTLLDMGAQHVRPLMPPPLV